MSRRRGKSVFDRALGGKNKKSSRPGKSGLTGMFNSRTKSSRKSKRSSGLLASFNGSGKGRRRGKGMTGQVAQSVITRMTPSERMRVENAVEDAVRDDRPLSTVERDAVITGNENFVRRLIRIARERLQRP